MFRKQSCNLRRIRRTREPTNYVQQQRTAHLAYIDLDVPVFVVVVPPPCLLPIAPITTVWARGGVEVSSNSASEIL